MSHRSKLKTRGRFKRTARIIGTLILWGFVALCSAPLIAFVLLPRLIGAVPYTVVSGSMQPEIPTGSIVVAREVAFEEIKVGDVITYQLESGLPTVVTHRVVGIDVIEDAPRLQTQGDANQVADSEAVRPEQVRGRVLYHAPWIGYVGQGISPQVRTGIATAVGAALLLYAATTLVQGARDRKGMRRR